MIRSSMPSPLTSPAPLTELPDGRKPRRPGWSGRPRSRGRWSPESLDRCRTPRSWRRHRHGRSGRHDGADDQIVDAVAIDVARPAHRAAGIGHRAAAPWMIRSASRSRGRWSPESLDRCRTPHSWRRQGRPFGSARGADDQIVDAVAIDVARPAHRAAGTVTSRGALDDQVGVAREVDGRGKALIGAEHHVAGAGIGTAVRVGTRGADDQIVDAIAIDVARPAHREAGVVIRRGALDDQVGARVARSMVAGKP